LFCDTERVRTVIDEGWAEIIDAPAPTDGDAVAASDIAMRTIAAETDQPEHEVEKTDAILAGLVVQYVRDRSTRGVIVLTDDQPAREGIKNAVTAQGYTDAISVYGLADIIGDDPGDSMRLIRVDPVVSCVLYHLLISEASSLNTYTYIQTCMISPNSSVTSYT